MCGAGEQEALKRLPGIGVFPMISSLGELEEGKVKKAERRFDSDVTDILLNMKVVKRCAFFLLFLTSAER